MQYYVYVYLNPMKPGIYQYGDYKFDFEPFYIGKGKGKRMLAHLAEHSINSPFNNIKNRILKKIIKNNLKPISFKLHEQLADEDAIALEIKLINSIGRRIDESGPLSNLTLGGEGTSGRPCSDETKKLFSEQRKGKKQTPAQYAANCAKTRSPELKEKARRYQLGRKSSLESIEKARRANLGQTRSDETKKLFSEQRKGKKQTPAQYAANCARINKFNYVTYDEFKKFYQTHKIRNSREWIIFISQNEIPSNIPKNPYTAYRKRNTWISWKDLNSYDTNPPVLDDNAKVESI